MGIDSDRPRLGSCDLQGVANLISSGRAKNILFLTGAETAVNAGIPDFRSPKTGLYDNIGQYNLTEPHDMFSLKFFRTNPHPFYHLAKKMFPGTVQPTTTHLFIKLLSEKGILRRLYTQNIDGLDRVAGMPEDQLVEAHGTFGTASCIDCKTPRDAMDVRKCILDSKVPKCLICGGYVKPDVVFFGEQLPRRFFDTATEDFEKCDLLIVCGTGLSVAPFKNLIHAVPKTCPRVLINKEKAGHNEVVLGKNQHPVMRELFKKGHVGEFKFGCAGNTRDVFIRGDCDETFVSLEELLGWGKQPQEKKDRR